MARPQAYDTNDLLQKATDIFWKKGYNNTSIKDLEDATGVSRISMYNSYQSKEGLFLGIIKLYHDKTMAYFDKTLESGDVDDILILFESMASGSSRTPATQYGCIMANSIVDLHSSSPQIQTKIREYREGIHAKFLDILQRSKDQLIPSFDPESGAELLVTILWGIFMTNRLYSGSTHSAMAVTQVRELLRLWRCKKQ